jgi:hypothetical protein
MSATLLRAATAQQLLFLNGLIVAFAIGIRNGRNIPAERRGDALLRVVTAGVAVIVSVKSLI